jgi:site-specific DNA-adenine methylase
MKDHERLVKLLRQTEYKFLLTYDDCNTARRLYSWANLRHEEWWYNTANIRTKTRKKGRELLITNFYVFRPHFFIQSSPMRYC